MEFSSLREKLLKVVASATDTEGADLRNDHFKCMTCASGRNFSEVTRARTILTESYILGERWRAGQFSGA